MAFQYLMRAFTNSLESFLDTIPKNSCQFTPQKISNFRNISTPMFIFNNQYSKYCKKFGLKQLVLHDQKHIFE